jgi:hypothetical protein
MEHGDPDWVSCGTSGSSHRIELQKLSLPDESTIRCHDGLAGVRSRKGMCVYYHSTCYKGKYAEKYVNDEVITARCGKMQGTVQLDSKAWY